MRAAVLTEANRPWQLRDLPDPTPADGQVVIRVRASGLAGNDVHLHRGRIPCALPIVLGQEAVGDVAALGTGVTTLKVGDRVGVPGLQKGCGHCRTCQVGRWRYCREVQTWAHLGGGNAELMLAWAEACVLLPEGLAYETAAPLFGPGGAVISALRNADARAGERVAVLGIGGLGHLAIQCAAALGLEVVALTGSKEKVELAKQLGATEAVEIGDDAGQALARAGGADIVLNTGNSAIHLGHVVSGLRPEGRLVNTAVVDGKIRFPQQHVLFLRQLRVIHTMTGDRPDVLTTLELAAHGKIKPWLELYSLEQANEALQRLLAGTVRFRAVLRT